MAAVCQVHVPTSVVTRKPRVSNAVQWHLATSIGARPATYRLVFRWRPGILYCFRAAGLGSKRLCCRVLPLLTKERGDRGLGARLLPPARLPFPLLIDSSALGLVPACRSVMATPRAEARGLFRKGVEAVLGSWPALQVAVENGFGGAYSQEKAEWMVEAVEQYFQSNADLELDEIEDFLAELMNNEFDTMIEDGSLAQVSQQLRLFFGQCQQGEGAAVHEAIVRLAQKKQEAKVAAAKSKPAEESSSEEEEGTEEEAMDCSAAPSMNGAQPSPPPSSGADPEDGWTLVRKKKK
ncbi:pre-rRNA-processing protein TSR2 homolog isoform X2 [Podarcis muralis]